MHRKITKYIHKIVYNHITCMLCALISNLPNFNVSQLIIHRAFNQSYSRTCFVCEFFHFSFRPRGFFPCHLWWKFCRPFTQNNRYICVFGFTIFCFSAIFFIVSLHVHQLHPICVIRNCKTHWIGYNFSFVSLKFIQTLRYWSGSLCFQLPSYCFISRNEIKKWVPSYWLAVFLRRITLA